MTGQKKYYQLIPEKIHQNLSVIEDILKADIKGFSTDNLKEAISIVAYHIRKKEEGEDEAAPLRMKDIKRLVPQGDKYFKGLATLDVITRSDHYIPNEISYKYNFAPAYRSRYITLPLENDELIKRIEKVYREINESEQFKTPLKVLRERQKKYLASLTIEPEAINFIERNFSEDINQYNYYIKSVRKIQNGKAGIYWIVDDTSGRLHSNVTNLPKELRPFLRINGKSLVNIDVRNSQPYDSILLLTNPSKVARFAKNTAFRLLIQNLKISDTKDIRMYIKLVVEGRFYEFLIDEFFKAGIDLPEDPTDKRDYVKKQVLRILFAMNRLPKNEINRKCRQVFIMLFPTVHRIFSKVRGRDTGDKFSSYGRFAILLQSIETHIMLDVVLKRIYKELPGTIAVTIHDSVMTSILTDDVQAVQKIIIEEFNSFVGFRPQIKIEDNSMKSKEINNNKQRL